MKKYYFTFGVEGQPFESGWVIVEAQSIGQAIAIFRAAFPDEHEGIVNCASYYSEEEFKQTEMYKSNSNLGSGCHTTISLQIKKETA